MRHGDMETWRHVELPLEKKVVGYKWIFTMSFEANGIADRSKVTLVMKGFTQTYGIDYQ